MASLRASEEGQAKITEARNRKGWRIKAEDTRPLKEASKLLLQRHGQANGWEENDLKWLRDLEKILRIDKEQVNELKLDIAKAKNGSVRDRIEQTIEEDEIFAKDISYGSWSRFAGRKRQGIKAHTFKVYCEVLGLSWEEIADREIPSTPQRTSRHIEGSRHNLPGRDRTAFVGRRKELKKLLALLSPNSPVNRIGIEGEGGLGKTALVLEAAYRCLHASLNLATSSTTVPVFDAIIFVSAQSQRLTGTGIVQRLRRERTQRDIIRAIARTLDIPELAYTALEDGLERLQKYLSRQQVLLIVDNLETIEDRDTVLALLYELPSTVKAVVTTRQPAPSLLPIRLDSLLQEDALDLIVHEVEEKGLELSPEDAEQIYEKTKGLPAAIVYTIGQLAAQSPIAEVLERLARATDDVSRYCFESSVKLLSESARHLLMALALFPQLALREAIAKVSAIEESITLADNLAYLQKLSLIKQREERYTMLPATRSYVLVQLENSPKFEKEARKHWLDWFLGYVRQHGSQEFQDWRDYDNLEQQWGNLSEAIEWCLGREQYEIFKEFSLYLGGFTRFRGYWDERLVWTDYLLQAAREKGDRVTIARALYDKVHTLTLVDRPARQQEAIDSCEAILKDSDTLEFKSRFEIMVQLAMLYINRKQFLLAAEWLEEAKTTLESADLTEEESLRLQIHLLYRQGRINLETGEVSQARKLYEQCLELAKKIDWQLGEMYTYGWLAIVEIEDGNLDAAEQLLKFVLPYSEQNNDKRSIAFCQRYYALLEQKRDNLTEARRWATVAKENFEKLKMLREFKEMSALCQ
ncbi:MAG: NB-ARC domain-containing protein [Spirulina sp.]